jgi:predicted Rossmann fold nucleotide-binding protein DprA/Smf involved in DNA uptake
MDALCSAFVGFELESIQNLSITILDRVMNKRAKPLSVARLQHSDSGYPTVLREYLSGRVPKTLTALGNFDILQRKKLALFCSVKCPGALILQTYDLARALRDAGVAVIGSFHSPMEKECLTLLLRGTQPVIVCPARSIDKDAYVG